MPEFQIDLHDGRTLSIDAESQDAALAGAQHYIQSNPLSTPSGAAAAGAVDAATGGFYDELRGYHQASDLPDWVDLVPGGGIVKAAGGAWNVHNEPRGVTNLVTGPGPYERRYEQGRDQARQAFETASEEHPGYYAGGEVGGALVTTPFLPGGRVAEGAGLLTRAGQAARAGAIYGGISGAGHADDGDRLGGAVTGALVGGGTGAVASPLWDLGASGARSGANAVGDLLRTQSGTEQGAAERVARAVMEGGGVPDGVLNASRSDAATNLALQTARDSPQAREALQDAADAAFAAQGDRAATMLDGLAPAPPGVSQPWHAGLEDLGRQYVDGGHDWAIAQHLSRAAPEDRNLFARGFAGALADRAADLPASKDLLDQAFINSPDAMRRAQIALGPDKARQLEGYLRLEDMANGLRNQLAAGVAPHEVSHGPGMGTFIAGELGERLGGHLLSDILGSWGEPVGTLLGVGFERAGHRIAEQRQALAGRIGTMLASSDPAVFARGLDAATRGRNLQGLRWLHNAMAPAIARTAGQMATGY